MSNKARNAVAFIPNLITLAALLAGLTSIRLSQGGQYDWAAFAILLAAVLDFSDGIVARSLGAESGLGAELDSLADLVSFGVAPALLVYDRQLHLFGETGWVITALYVLTAGYRLARFNAQDKLDLGGGDAAHFRGMPSTASAMFMISASQLADGTLKTFPHGALALAIVTVLASFLMVSSISVPKLGDLIRRKYKK